VKKTWYRLSIFVMKNSEKGSICNVITFFIVL